MQMNFLKCSDMQGRELSFLNIEGKFGIGQEMDMLSSKATLSKLFEPAHDKTNKMACAPSEDSDQPGYPPRLIRVFAVRSMGS